MKSIDTSEVLSQKIIACQDTLENLGFFYPKHQEAIKDVSAMLSWIPENEAIAVTIACCEMLGNQIKKWGKLQTLDMLDSWREVPSHLPNPHVNPFEYIYWRWGMSEGVSLYFPKEMVDLLSAKMSQSWWDKYIMRFQYNMKKIVFGKFISMHSLKKDSDFSNIESLFDIVDIEKSHIDRTGAVIEVLTKKSHTSENEKEINNWDFVIRLNEEIWITFKKCSILVGTHNGKSDHVQQPILWDILALSLSAGISFPVNIAKPGVIWKLSTSSDYKDMWNVKLSPDTKKKLFPIFQAWKGNSLPENTADKRDRRLIYKLLSDSIYWSSVEQSVQRTKDRVGLLFQHPEQNPDTVFVKSWVVANHVAIAISTIFLEKKWIVKPGVNNHQYYYENKEINHFIHPETNLNQEYNVVKNSWNILCFCMENDESKILEFLENEAQNNQEREKIFILDITKNPLVPLDDVFRYCKIRGIRVITTCSLTKFQRGWTKRFYGIINLYGFTQDEVELATKLIEKNDAGSTHDDLIRLPRIQKSDIMQWQELVAKQKDALKVELVRMSSELGLTVTHSWNSMIISRGSDIKLEIISGTYYLIWNILNTPANTPEGYFWEKSRNKRDKFVENCSAKWIDSRDSFWLENTQIQSMSNAGFRIAFGTKSFDMGQTQDIANLIMWIFE